MRPRGGPVSSPASLRPPHTHSSGGPPAQPPVTTSFEAEPGSLYLGCRWAPRGGGPCGPPGAQGPAERLGHMSPAPILGTEDWADPGPSGGSSPHPTPCPLQPECSHPRFLLPTRRSQRPLAGTEERAGPWGMPPATPPRVPGHPGPFPPPGPGAARSSQRTGLILNLKLKVTL